MFSRSIEVSSKHLTELSMKVYQPEVIISPRVGHIGILQNINVNDLVEAGITATEETMSQIKAEANWMKKIQRKVKHQVMPEPPPEIWENVEE